MISPVHPTNRPRLTTQVSHTTSFLAFLDHSFRSCFSLFLGVKKTCFKSKKNLAIHLFLRFKTKLGKSSRAVLGLKKLLGALARFFSSLRLKRNLIGVEKTLEVGKTIFVSKNHPARKRIARFFPSGRALRSGLASLKSKHEVE